MIPPPPAAGPLALYLHVPFCATKCPYCDFNTYAGIEGLMDRYASAVRAELGMWGEVLGAPRVSTVFLGGGTPSYLRPGMVGAILGAARGALRIDPSAEITAEANPDDLTDMRLEELAEAGVNRLSVGVQSLDDGLLAALGRRHGASQAMAAVHAAGRAGFSNLSIDLMYGLPGQSLIQWTDTLGRALDLGTAHISAYALTLERGTPLSRAVESGEMPEPDPDLAAEMYLAAGEAMSARGLRRYEISNWCAPGMESRHNLAYWLNRPFLGAGPGAHSHLGGARFSIIRSPREYTLRLSRPSRPDRSRAWPRLLRSLPVVEGVSEIDPAGEMAETMMLGLRLEEGVSDARFRARFGRGLSEVYGPTLEEAASDGLVDWRRGPGGHARLSARGRLLGNEVFSRFFGSGP